MEDVLTGVGRLSGGISYLSVLQDNLRQGVQVLEQQQLHTHIYTHTYTHTHTDAMLG